MKKLTILMSVVAALSATVGSAQLSSTFVQLNRTVAKQGTAAWSDDLARMRAVGIDSLIVQWSGDDEVSYVRSDDLPQQEQYDTVADIMAAAGKQGMTVFLGLHNDGHFWSQITARDRALKEYFLVRVAQNERLQRVLLARFGTAESLAGTYVPDEIDDLSWRDPARRGLLRDYLTLLDKRLASNDESRPVLISAFFRRRTAPDVFVRNLVDAVAGTRIERVLVQDGLGTRASVGRHVGAYFKALADGWPESGPELWCVVEGFEQTSPAGKPFTAVPAPAERLLAQIAGASEVFENRLVLFTFLDYADPDLGPAGAGLYEALRAKPGEGTR